MTGEGTRCSEILCGSPNTRFSTPAGTPASAKQRTSSTRDAGGLLGRLDHDRAAGGQRAGDLAHRLVDREVPRREGRDRTDRLAQHARADRRLPRRDDAPIGAAPFLGIPLDVVGRRLGFEQRFGERLAVVERHHFGDALVPLAHENRRPAAASGSDRARRSASRRRNPRSAACSARSSSAAPASGSSASGRLVGRVQHLQGAAACGLEPLAIDVKSQLRVHDQFGTHRCRMVLNVDYVVDIVN